MAPAETFPRGAPREPVIPAQARAARIAFFDVDETLITAKSMFDFLRHWLAGGGDDGTRYEQAAGALHTAAAGGTPRTEINRSYYRLFAGADGEAVTAAGAAWYAAYRERPAGFVETSLDALSGHKEAGHMVALVSGSFRACLEPLAAEVGADLILCSEPLAGADGRLTGEIAEPMIGRNKAAAAARTIARLGANAADCFAYGDHSSDLDLLRVVGRPTVVGEDPVLTQQARVHGWARLPRTTVQLTAWAARRAAAAPVHVG